MADPADTPEPHHESLIAPAGDPAPARISVPGVSPEPVDSTSVNPHDAALQHASWRSRERLSRGVAGLAGACEDFLAQAGFDRGPWLAVALAAGIAAWFGLANRWQWLALMATGIGVGFAALAALSPLGRFSHLRQALVAVGFALTAGCGLIWVKSEFAGTPPIAHATVASFAATVLERVEEPAEGKVLLHLATREPRSERPIRVRLQVPAPDERPDLAEGAVIRLRARLMPPQPPRLPGARDTAREAWFSGLAAYGSAIGSVEVVRPAVVSSPWARGRHFLSAHVRARVAGSAGGIAATLVSGNRGGIAWADQQAMRDTGLTHLLAISGLHVSAVVAGAYFLAFRLLALWPWLALRLRLPVLATLAGAGAGVGYTLLTGMHLPTVRACTGALLVLGGMLTGRQPLTMRLLASAAVVVMLLWPEEVVGPSFQMSFGSVVAIIALHSAAPVHAFLAPRAEAAWQRVGRDIAVLLLSGMVIDLALMPVALFHFHRAGAYGSLANLIAIPLVTFVAMPAIAAGLVLDVVGAGAPAWWVVDRSLTLLLQVTHWLASRPGAVAQTPTLTAGVYVLFVGGLLWLGLWRGRVRLLGLVPILAGVLALSQLRPPDVVITGDGRNLGIVREDGILLLLRMGRSPYTREAMQEVLGLEPAETGEKGGTAAPRDLPGRTGAQPTGLDHNQIASGALAPSSTGRSASIGKGLPLAQADPGTGNVGPLESWPGASCNHDFCLVSLNRGGRTWRLLAARNEAFPASRELARACAEVDIVITSYKIFAPCRPALLRADKAYLLRSGGLALDLESRQVTSVADAEGEHPWWRAPHRALEADSEPTPETLPDSAIPAARPGVAVTSGGYGSAGQAGHTQSSAKPNARPNAHRANPPRDQ